VSNSGLARAGITEPLTTEQIAALIADPPPWLTRERETHAEARREQQRLRELREEPGKSTVPAKLAVRTSTSARRTAR
jgi:hypothetical protein